MTSEFEIRWRKDWLVGGPVTKDYIELAKKVLDVILYFEEEKKEKGE